MGAGAALALACPGSVPGPAEMPRAARRRAAPARRQRRLRDRERHPVARPAHHLRRQQQARGDERLRRVGRARSRQCRSRGEAVQRPEIVPALAESWEVLDDGKRYRFKLRSGVTFHDGAPFNADAVVFNFRRVIDPEFEYFFERASSLGTRRCATSSGRGGRRHDGRPRARPGRGSPFLSQLGTFLSPGLPLMMSPKSVEEYGNEGANAHPAGTGPFKVTAIEPGVSVTTERNPDYWDDPLPYLDRITYVVMPEQSTRVFALEGRRGRHRHPALAGQRRAPGAQPAIPWSRARSPIRCGTWPST